MAFAMPAIVARIQRFVANPILVFVIFVAMPVRALRGC
jgi:hypothetical protein